MILLSTEASSNEIFQKNKAQADTDVVSLVFCESSLPAEDKIDKKMLEEVHTYAELKHDPRASLPDSFTVCSTIMITGCQNDWPTFFYILDNNNDQFLGPMHSHGSIESRFLIALHEGKSPMVTGKVPPLFPNQWTRSCMAVNTTSGLIHWVVEGTLVVDGTFVEVNNSNNRPRDLSKKLLLGVRSYGGSWFAISQKVTNLNIYASPLSIEKMKSMTRGGSCVEEGDYLAWGDMEWILHGQARKETTEKEATCEEKPLADLYYTPFPDMGSCMHHCQNLGTRVPSVATSEDWTKLQTFLKKKLYDKKLKTLEIWLPIDDRETEGVWKDFYTGKVVQNFTQPWLGSKPDGGEVENCARLLNENTWSDIYCDYPNYACMCSHKSTTTLRLKGLCPSSAIDVHYKPINQQTDIRKMKLQGLTQTSIEYVAQEKMWKIYVTDSNVTGISKVSHASFTLGKHNWTIKGDEGCNSGDTYITELKMSGCQEDEFTCNDGQCVRMDQRCNQLPDCRDKSDERNCGILILEDGYNMEVPPVTSSEPVHVSVSIDLLRLVDINEEDYSIEIQFEIILKWKEKRATYQNLKKQDSLNTLSQKDINALWLPKVIYENTDQKETTRLGSNWEWETKVIVRKEVENGTMSGLESVDETEIFEGSQNRLVMNQTYTHTFQCNYKLSYYPFDTQVNEFFLAFTFKTYSQTCSIDLAMGSLDRTTVTLIPDQLVMSQELDMPIFRVIDWNLRKGVLRTGKQGISMVVVMKRKITSEMMTTYFPSENTFSENTLSKNTLLENTLSENTQK